MISYAVIFTPTARARLIELYQYIAAATSPDVAAAYVDAVMTYCEGLATFPRRGLERNDIRPGLRITNYRRRVAIAFEVTIDTVFILGVFYGGQDYEAALRGA